MPFKLPTFTNEKLMGISFFENDIRSSCQSQESFQEK